jgi:hypothetical protein
VKLKLRALELRVETPERGFGRRCVFADGLNVVRGANSAGKTQLFQAVVFALGVEDVLSSPMPLGSAFTSEIADDSGATESVIASWVRLEVQNAAQRTLTIRRHATHPQRKLNLIEVWEGGAVTSPGSEVPLGDFFVNEAGAATHELGFHRLLAEVLGWELPEVPRYSSDPGLLYLQVMFPFLYADQRTGWASAGPRPVTKYQIREPARRAAEFLLGMSGPRALAERDALRRQLDELALHWSTEAAAARAALGAAGGRLEGVPDVPSGLRGNARQATAVRGSMLVLRGDEWVTVEEELERLASASAHAAEAPPAGSAGTEDAVTREALLEAEDRLGSTLAAASVIEQQLTLSEAQRAALDRRIAGLQEETARLRDVRKLVRLGSHDPLSHLADQQCPTCHQALLGVETDDPSTAMDVEESAAVVAAQLATVQGMREQVDRATAGYRDSFQALQRESDLLRVRVRALRSDLVQPSGYPSRGELATQVTAEVRLAELSRATGSVQVRLETLQRLADDVFRTRRQLAAIPADTSQEDAAVVAAVTAAMQEGLQETGFGSYAAEKITLDPDSLRPRRAGLDIDDDVSASDVVRVKIAYLDAVRKVAAQRGAPHPGLLLLDEPRQHEMQEEHFRAALGRLAAAGEDGDQVIVSSAAPAEVLATYLPPGGAVTVLDLGPGRILKPE